jgi:hypothetical protein
MQGVNLLMPDMGEMLNGDRMRLDEISLFENPLTKYPNIGIDVDNTLIGNNPKKEILWNFIEKNYTRHNFYIITFRFGASWIALWNDIVKGTDGKLKPNYFREAFTPGKEISMDYLTYIGIIKLPKKEALKKIEEDRIDWNKTRQGAQELLLYKGKTCWVTNCKVLVDDDKKRVVDGCIKYRITYLHPSQI